MVNTRRRAYLLWIAVALVPLIPRQIQAQEPAGYTLGVVPSVPPVETHAKWWPFAERLSRDTGLVFRLKLYEEMAAFERDIVAPEAPDFVFANALQAVVARAEQGYEPLVRSERPIWAELFVRSDSPVKTVADLSGKRVAFVGSKNL